MSDGVSARELHDGFELRAAARRGDAALAAALIAGRADVNARSPAGLPPLYEAARAGHVGAVEALLAGGADVDAKCGRAAGAAEAAGAAAWESAWELGEWDGPGTFEAEQWLCKPAAQKFVAKAASVYRGLFGVGLGAGKWRRGGGFAAYAVRVKNGLKLMIETIIQELQLQDAPDADDGSRVVKRKMKGCIDDGLRRLRSDALDWIAIGCRRFWEHESETPIGVWTGEVADAPVEQTVLTVDVSAEELAAFKVIAADPAAQDLVFDEPLFNRFRDCFWRAEWRGAGRGTAPHAEYLKDTMRKYMDLYDALNCFLALK